MRKTLSWIIAGLFTLAIIPFGFGWYTQRQVKQFLLQDHGIASKEKFQIDYKMGWLHSAIKISLPDENATTPQDAPPLLTFEGQIDHGPLIKAPGWRLGLGVLKGRLSFKNWPIIIDQKMVFMPQGWEQLDLNTQPTEKPLHMGAISVHAERAFGPYTSKLHAEIPLIEDTDHLFGFQSALISAEGSIHSENQLRQTWEMTAQSAKWNGQVQGPGLCQFVLDHIDVVALNHLHQQHQAGQMPQADTVYALFAHQPTLNIHLNQGTETGPIQLEIKASSPPLPDKNERKNNGFRALEQLSQATHAALDLSFPKAFFITHFPAQNGSSNEEVYQELIQRGWLLEKDKNTTLHAAYEQGIITINGHPLGDFKPLKPKTTP